MSTVKSKKLQVGTDASASNNFTIYQPATPDGTLRIGVGNADSPTEVARFDATGMISGGATPDALSTATGSAPSYSARAWVAFQGTGTVSIRGSGNVSSITDLNTGRYAVNFSTTMPDTNYSVVYTCSNLQATNPIGNSDYTQTPAANAESVGYAYVASGDNDSNGYFDAYNNYVAIFR